MADVVSLRGNDLPQPGEPSEKLVAFLDDQLQRAKAGEIIGFAGAALGADKLATYWVVGFTGGFSMIGALDCANVKLRQIAMGED